jgi:hypothetical protein
MVNVHAHGGITFPGQGEGLPGPLSQVHGLLVKRAFGFAQGYSAGAAPRPSGFGPAAGKKRVILPSMIPAKFLCFALTSRFSKVVFFFFPHK